MDAHAERGRLLIERGRYQHAEKELRQALAENPEDPLACALLGIALLGQEKHLAAERMARDAVRLAPDFDFPLYVLSGVLNATGKRREALDVIDRAIEIDPEDANFWERRAQILIGDDEWEEALLAADSALEIDPESVDAANLRSLCLQQLGRAKEAEATAAGALQKDPDDAFAHANRGWSYLQQGNHRAAETHLREALRLEPDMEWARQGVVTSLKSRNIVYRGMLKYFFWMSRLSSGAQWAVIIGVIVGRRALNKISEMSPELRTPAIVLGVLLFVFVLLTWVADSVANAVLLLHPFGRLALSRSERFFAWATAAVMLAALGLLIPFGLTGDLTWGLAAAGFGAAMILVGGVANASESRRTRIGVIAALIGALGAAALVGTLTGSEHAGAFGAYYVFGVVAFTWVAALWRGKD